MAGGGTAEAMKFSDVLILVGIGILCAGFIIHGWVEKTPISAEDNPEMMKSVDMFKGDKMIFSIDSEGDSSGIIQISDESGVIDTKEFDLFDSDDFSFTFKAKDSGTYQGKVMIDSGEAQADIDVNRILMLDYIIYPIGVAILLFGIQKRREDKNSEVMDAEIGAN